MTTFEEEKRAFMEFFQCGKKFLEREGRSPDDPNDTKKTGVDRILFSTFPIQDFHETVLLEYVMHDIRIYSAEKDIKAQKENGDGRWLSGLDDKSEFFMKIPEPADIPEGFNSLCDLVATLRLVIWEIDDETGSKSVADIIEQDVSIGWLPRMTVNGTFFHGGIEKRYSGEGLAVDCLGRFLQLAFLGVEMSIITTLAHIDGKTVHPFDLIECGPLRDKTEEFFEELVPVLGN
ncbi:MAG: hypothetical protein QGE99_03735 [SAR202 cluster bacterium]|jgi:DNA-directed RNA polymerase beta subunit|nr:hypothetical protein [SAR202 cluster bacterium]|tara:strand:+ start:360 stop:1058 length:699 start_codon:yes stop_codon:yes gene_type:complete